MKKIKGKNQLFIKKCAVCGEEKAVWNLPDYAWIFKGKFCCSYTCYRKLEKPYLEKYKKRIFKNIDKDM